ncbi:MAG: phenylalanine 4-monooxygenase [Polyangiaceae bacterium]
MTTLPPSKDRIPATSVIEPPPSGTHHAGGAEELVELSADHPGFADADYRGRRNEIARLALDYVEGDPVPEVPYSDEEHDVWRTVWTSLAPLHERYACRAYVEASSRLSLPRHRIPQLAEVNQGLAAHGAFRMLPVAGLVSARMFLSYLARGIFLSTQYIRHFSVPLYTPEPDVVHELVGHAATFAHPDFVAMSRTFGEAALRSQDEETLSHIARLYWFTLEFGVVEEGGRLAAVGAGLLSSFGELGRFETEARLVPFDVATIAENPYDPTTYQATLYVAKSLPSMFDATSRYLERLR